MPEIEHFDFWLDAQSLHGTGHAAQIAWRCRIDHIVEVQRSTIQRRDLRAQLNDVRYTLVRANNICIGVELEWFVCTEYQISAVSPGEIDNNIHIALTNAFYGFAKERCVAAILPCFRVTGVQMHN